MSREPRSERHFAIEGEWFDPIKSPHAFYGPYRRTRPLTVSRWARLLRWLRAGVFTWNKT